MRKLVVAMIFCALLAVPHAAQAECDKKGASEVILMITEGGIASRTFNGAATVRYEMSDVWDQWSQDRKEKFVRGVRGAETCLHGQVTVRFHYAGKEVAKIGPTDFFISR